MIGELFTGIITLIPSIFLLFYLKKERKKWQRKNAELNEKLEMQSYKLLETESRLLAAKGEIDNLERVVVDESHIPMPPRECKERELRPARRETLLLVESNRRALFMLGALLKADYNLLYAQNNSEALQRVTASPLPQLVICPVKTQEIDGIELFNTSRRADNSRPLPFIFICEGDKELKKVSSLKEENLDFIDRFSLKRELTERVANRLALSSLFDEIHNYKRDRRTEELFDNYCNKKGLKGKQKEVANLIMKRPEKTNLLLGKELAITQNTLRTHIKRIGEKLDLPGKKGEISRHLRAICYGQNAKYKER